MEITYKDMMNNEVYNVGFTSIKSLVIFRSKLENSHRFKILNISITGGRKLHD